MDVVFAVLAGAVGIGAGGVAGWYAGVWARHRRSLLYWSANAFALLMGVLIAFVGMNAQLYPVAVAGLGVVVGGLTGLKYGYAHVVGQWRDLDGGDPE